MNNTYIMSPRQPSQTLFTTGLSPITHPPLVAIENSRILIDQQQ